MEGLPLVLVDDGDMIDDRMKKARVNESDILESGRRSFGLERLEQIKYAILEKDGSISVIPRADAAWRSERGGGR